MCECTHFLRHIKVHGKNRPFKADFEHISQHTSTRTHRVKCGAFNARRRCVEWSVEPLGSCGCHKTWHSVEYGWGVMAQSGGYWRVLALLVRRALWWCLRSLVRRTCSSRCTDSTRPRAPTTTNNATVSPAAPPSTCTPTPYLKTVTQVHTRLTSFGRKRNVLEVELRPRARGEAIRG